MEPEQSPSFLDVINALYHYGHDTEADEIIVLGMISCSMNRLNPIDIFKMTFDQVKNLIRFDSTSKPRIKPYEGNWSTNVWGKDYV